MMDTAGLKMINITGDSLRGYKSETLSYQRIIGAVVITHEGTTMTCDSAHFYFDKNFVEAYSNVHIISSNGSSAQSDYIQYTGNTNMAQMTGNVKIIDSANTLYTEQLSYNLKTKVGKYYNGGTLQTDETTVSSNEGMYDGLSKQTFFKKDVIITNPKFTIDSKELTYNTANKVIKFLDESTINGENSIVKTKGGTYDSKNEKAVFTKRTSVANSDQTITGNTLTYDEKSGAGNATGDVIIVDMKNNSTMTAKVVAYNKLSGYGKATTDVVIVQDGGKTILTADEAEYNKKIGYAKAVGNVVVTDTAEKSTLRCGVAEFNENSKFMLATVNPKLVTVADKDSTFMRADTMMSIRAINATKLKRIEVVTGEKKNKVTTVMYNLLLADSTYRSAKTEEPKLILANRGVKIFADSMQAVCDSLSYSQLDSTFKLFKSPVLWSTTRQSVADTIFIHTVSNKLSEVNLRGAAFLLSGTGYRNMYDQVSGKYIDAYFIENEINMVKVNQNAESLYYAKDDKGAFIGVNKAESAMMNVYFVAKELDHIAMLEDPKGVVYPIDKISDSDRFLTAFKLYTERKPQSKQAIMGE
jgi:lipopolysaccharide export system protein LptA